MKLRRSSAIVASLLLSVPFIALAQQKSHNVVFAMTSADDADWNMTTGNIRHLIAALPAGSVSVEVVAYGPGLSFVRAKGSSETAILELEKEHVTFVACENSMRTQHVTKEELAPGVTTVPSGVAEVVLKQEEGWSYIKAGR